MKRLISKRRQNSRRINLKSHERVHGLTPRQIEETYRARFSNIWRTQDFRMYKVNTTPPRFFVKVVNLHASQTIFKIVPQGNTVEFVEAGKFDSMFTERIISDPTLRGHGLGTRALKTFEAAARRRGEDQQEFHSNRKSTLLLFLKNGYKLDQTYLSFPLRLRVVGKQVVIRNEQELIDLLENPKVPENLPKDIHVERTLRKRKKKQT